MTSAIPGLHIHVRGDGPPVVLVHGSNQGDVAQVWARQRELAEGYRLLDIEPAEPPRLSPADLAAIRATLAEPPPSQAVIPLDQLARAPFPKLVVSGAWNAGLEAVADVLTARLPAERAVIPGAGHCVQR